VRVIAATNKDLKLAIEQREFREDLYFRISTFRLRISPLKDRPGDILPLTSQSLARHVKDGVPYSLTPEAQRLLVQYPWPGNVRELENVVQRAVVLSSGRVITPAHLMFDDGVLMDQASFPPVEAAVRDALALAQVSPASLTSSAVANAQPIEQSSFVGQDSASALHYLPAHAIQAVTTAEHINLEQAVKVSEHQVIMAAIQSTESRIEAAAKLGISPRTLRYKIAQLREMGLIEGVAA